jgi:hypothetical protein
VNVADDRWSVENLRAILGPVASAGLVCDLSSRPPVDSIDAWKRNRSGIATVTKLIAAGLIPPDPVNFPTPAQKRERAERRAQEQRAAANAAYSRSLFRQHGERLAIFGRNLVTVGAMEMARRLGEHRVVSDLYGDAREAWEPNTDGKAAP